MGTRVGHKRSLVFVLVGLFSVTSSPRLASAQYFGRNKVQYRTFEFEVLKADHFDIYFYPEERKAVEIAARLAERWHTRLGQILHHDLRGRQPLILYASHPHFEQTNAIPGELTEGTGGVTEPLRRRIVLPFGGPIPETDHVLGHELVHAYQFDITIPPSGSGGGTIPRAERLPLWFVEGMAEYLSLGPVDAHTAMWMRDASRQETLPTIRQLNNPKYFPYRWGHAFWAYVAGRWGDDVVGDLLRAAADSGDPGQAIEAILGITPEQLSMDWHAALRDTYRGLARITEVPASYGRLLTPGDGLGGDLNVSPALSPDGKRMAFLSERSLFSIDLYVADTDTGKITKRISQTTLDPHFSSLEFINSAGAWAPQGTRFVSPAVTGGRAVLAIFDIARSKIDREVPVPEVDELFNPTWSPDGQAIAFSGLTGGLTDLFVYDLKAARLRRLTSDAFADLQPSWSPDGRQIAFVTDRFSSDVSALDFGNYRIGLLDPVSRAIHPLRGFDRGKNINPQWSPDGNRLYFLSDRTGVTNVYQLEVGSGKIRQSTDLFTGVSGITAASPALSAASRAELLAFSVYENGTYRIYATDRAPVLAGQALANPADTDVKWAALPPLDRPKSQVATLLHKPVVGLPPAGIGLVEPYHPSLSLDYVGQPTFAVGTDRFGTFAGGGLSLFFGDTLGDHNLGTAVQINSSLAGDFDVKDIGVAAAYQNLRRRWNWGGIVEQVPYRSGAFQSGIGTVGGETAVIDQEVLFRQTSRDVTGVVSYPFSRVQRLELSGGYRNLSLERQMRTTATSLSTGEVLVDETQTTSLGDTLRFGEASAALVYDNSFFGATSPVLGQRYRLEVSPTIGSIRLSSLLADYRRYLMPAQLYTIAGRILHYGRYGPGAEDSRLTPLFIGYPNLVRGYDVGSFSAAECGNDPSGGCPAFDRLIGSRMLIGNLELRFPLLRPFGLRRDVYGPIPIEAAFFADAGVAWDRGSSPAWFGGHREGVSSVGAALRVNALGFAVVQFDIVRPLQRPGRGWMYEFSFGPGF